MFLKDYNGSWNLMLSRSYHIRSVASRLTWRTVGSISASPRSFQRDALHVHRVLFLSDILPWLWPVPGGCRRTHIPLHVSYSLLFKNTSGKIYTQGVLGIVMAHGCLLISRLRPLPGEHWLFSLICRLGLQGCSLFSHLCQAVACLAFVLLVAVCPWNASCMRSATWIVGDVQCVVSAGHVQHLDPKWGAQGSCALEGAFAAWCGAPGRGRCGVGVRWACHLCGAPCPAFRLLWVPWRGRDADFAASVPSIRQATEENQPQKK